MKTIKLMLIALIIPVFAIAQDKSDMKAKAEMNVEETAKMQTEWMKANLDLNEDQLEDVAEINQKYVEKREEAFMEEESKENKWKEIEKNWNEQMEELQDVLDESQVAKLEEVKSQWYDEIKLRLENDTHQEADDRIGMDDDGDDDDNDDY